METNFTDRFIVELANLGRQLEQPVRNRTRTLERRMFPEEDS